MARVPEEAFPEGTEIVRVYLAGALGEAQAAERVLDQAGVDYAAVPERYSAPSALGARVRTGVGLWVPGAALDAAADALERAGMTSGLVQR
jgi:hypothetical protein